MNEEQRKILEQARRRVAQERAKAEPEMGGIERFGRGALQSVRDIGFGAQQLGAEAGAALGMVEPSTVQSLRAQQEQRAREAAPFMETGAGRAGYLAGTIGTALLPGAALGRVPGVVGRAAQAVSAPRTLAGAAGVGGALGAAQPLTQEQSRLTSAALGAGAGMAGQAVARGVSRLAQPVTSAPRPQITKAAERLQQAGVPVDISERMGSENLRIVRRFLTDNPISASTMKKAQEATQVAFNKAALKLIGEQGEAAIPEVLSRADDRIGSVMDDIAARNKIKIDDQMIDDLANIESTTSMTVSAEQFAPVRNQLDNILQKVEKGDVVSGDAYQRIRTLAADMGKNPALAKASKSLRETIDSALERTAGKADAEAIKTARKQYRNLMKIQDSMGLTETGDISVAKLAAATSTKRERGAALKNRGDAELARLARSAMTMREAFPQSGTVPRAAVQALGGSVLPGAGLAGASFLQGETPSDTAIAALIGAGLGAAGTFGAARAYQNPAFQRYLMQGVRSPLARRVMMGPGVRGAATYAAPAGLLSAED